ncbi:MAG: transketolase [Bacteroidia bacterium]|nr:transketolase [Bacteroidia bacterium]
MNPTAEQISQLESIACQVRRDIVRMVHGAKSGHPGGSLGCVELLVSLYFHAMKHSPNFSMEGHGEDLFFLSNGHISPVWYSVLARSGYFPVSELKTFRRLNSRLQGHPATEEGLPGVRVATGSLGQGLSVAVGAALAKRMNQDTHFVYCLTGDGELNEGQIWEAAMFANHHRVDNLIVFVDVNGQQIDGPTKQVMDLGNLSAKWGSFGWIVREIPNGNQMSEILSGIHTAKTLARNGKPVVILVKTVMGKGVDFMEGTHKWHGVAPNDEQLAQALTQLPETLGDY